VLESAASPDEFDEPDAFIRLTVGDRHISTEQISTYYADSDEARDLERSLADGGTAIVVLSGDGDPLLDAVVG
jgi:hypothetical protein